MPRRAPVLVIAKPAQEEYRRVAVDGMRRRDVAAVLHQQINHRPVILFGGVKHRLAVVRIRAGVEQLFDASARSLATEA